MCVFDVSGDVHPEEVLLLSGLLPGEAPWRFLLSHGGESAVLLGHTPTRMDSSFSVFQDVEERNVVSLQVCVTLQ